jgi:hypothetical protein
MGGRTRQNTLEMARKQQARQQQAQKRSAELARLREQQAIIEAPQSEEFKVAQRTAQQTPISVPSQAQQPQAQQQQAQSTQPTMTSGYGAQQTKTPTPQQATGMPVIGSMAQQVANQGAGGTQQAANQFKLPSTAGLAFGGA